MTCYHPMQAILPDPRFSVSKKPIIFKKGRDDELVSRLKVSRSDDLFKLPCGGCIGCRLEYSRQWAIRCMHEASLYADNCFITLTYSNEELPYNLSLDKKAFPNFMKRLRKYLSNYGTKVRYYHCGEYGDQYHRPHYHACIFNYDFPDKVHWRTERGYKIYRSEILEKLWPFGFSTIGAVTFKSAAYVARYIMKKQGGKKAKDYYRILDPNTGNYIELQPEYATMSRRSGIGKEWFDRYKKDVYTKDYVIVNGKKVRPPKYYDTLFSLEHPLEFDDIKLSRKQKALEFAHDNTDERLEVKEIIKLEKLNKLCRKVE